MKREQYSISILKIALHFILELGQILIREKQNNKQKIKMHSLWIKIEMAINFWPFNWLSFSRNENKRKIIAIFTYGKEICHT